MHDIPDVLVTMAVSCCQTGSLLVQTLRAGAPVTIALTHGGALSNLPLFLAIDCDLFAGLGLDIAAPGLASFGSTVGRLRDGSAMLGTTGFTQVLADADISDPLVAVAGSGLRGMAVIGRAGMAAGDLAGAAFGTFVDDPMQVLAADWLTRSDLASRVSMRNMPSLAEAARQLRTGEVAAITTVEPWISRLRLEGMPMFSDGTDLWGATYPDTILVAPRSLVARDPDIVTGVIRAMLRAERMIRDAPHAALAAVSHRFPGFTIGELEAGLLGQPPRVDLRGLEPVIAARWPTIRRLQGRDPAALPPGVIDLRCLEAALALEAPRLPTSSPAERTPAHA